MRWRKTGVRFGLVVLGLGLLGIVVVEASFVVAALLAVANFDW